MKTWLCDEENEKRVTAKRIDDNKRRRLESPNDEEYSA